MKSNFPEKWTANKVQNPCIYKSELDLQAKLVQWFYKSFPEFRICTIPISDKGTQQLRSLLFHNLNNAKSKIEAAKLSGAGLVKGTPDLKLAVARGGLHGLYIELKIGKKKPEQHQIEVMNALRSQGYACEWINTLEDGIELINYYLSL